MSTNARLVAMPSNTGGAHRQGQQVPAQHRVQLPDVAAGTPTSTATRRCHTPAARASSAAGLPVTASARRRSTLAGNDTCVRRGTDPVVAAGGRRYGPPARAPNPTAPTASRSRSPGNAAVRNEGRSRPSLRQALPSSPVHPCHQTATPLEPPAASAHDGAIVLSLVGGQHPGALTGLS
jgi:hypothetical protein